MPLGGAEAVHLVTADANLAVRTARVAVPARADVPFTRLSTRRSSDLMSGWGLTRGLEDRMFGPSPTGGEKLGEKGVGERRAVRARKDDQHRDRCLSRFELRSRGLIPLLRIPEGVQVRIEWTGRSTRDVDSFSTIYQVKVEGVSASVWISDEALQDFGLDACQDAAERKLRAAAWQDSNKVTITTADFGH